MATRRLGRGLRDELRVIRSLAERHYWARLRSPGLVLPAATPVCDDRCAQPPALWELHCPVCALREPLRNSGSSTALSAVGSPVSVSSVEAVLTCPPGNNGSGAEYGAEAAPIAPADDLDEFTGEERAELDRRRVGLEQIVGIDVRVLRWHS